MTWRLVFYIQCYESSVKRSYALFPFGYEVM